MKSDDWKEFLGMLGLGGTVVSLSQVLLFERGVLASMEWNWKIVLYLCGYVLCLVAMYVITALFLQWNDAVVFNMHLLTSDIIAAVLTYFFFDDPPTLVYFIALAITIVGVVLYNSKQPVNDLERKLMKVEEEESKVDVEKDTDSKQAAAYMA